MNSYEIIAGQPVSKEIHALVRSVKAGFGTIVSRKGLLSYETSIESVQPIDVLRYYVEAGLDVSTSRALTNIYLSHLNSTEINSAGSGVIFSLAFYLHMEKALQYQKLSSKCPDFTFHSFSGKRASMKDLKKVLSCFCDQGTSDLVIKASEVVGAEGSITLKTSSSSSRTTIEVDDMYRFDATVNEVFVQQTGRSSFELTHPAIVTIDGMIESTSEIESIMRQSFETGQPVVIAARGYQQDVANTLAHNYVHGKLRILPVEVRYDELGANSLIDISKIAQSKFVNSLRGDLISTVTLEEDSGSVDRIKIANNTLSIDKELEYDSVHYRTLQRQRLKLMKKLEGSSDAVEKIINSRIKSLTPSHCTLSIKVQKGMSGVEKDRATNCIRMMKDVSTHGFVDLTTTEIHDSYFMSKLKEELVKSGIRYVPTKALNAGIRSAAACSKTFLQIGACLVIDEEPDTRI